MRREKNDRVGVSLLGWEFRENWETQNIALTMANKCNYPSAGFSESGLKWHEGSFPLVPLNAANQTYSST